MPLADLPPDVDAVDMTSITNRRLIGIGVLGLAAQLAIGYWFAHECDRAERQDLEDCNEKPRRPARLAG